jgi:ammonia channel protein AmtB
MKRFIATTFAVVAVLFAPAVFAADLNTGDTAWILTATALVLFMTLPGLALFYGGLVRSKNVLSILMQCFVITSLVSLLWLIGGYSLALGAVTGMVAGLGTIIPASGFVGPAGALVIGVLAGVFASNALGIFSGQMEIDIPHQLGMQAIGVGATLVYTAAVTAILLLLTDKLIGNRVSGEEEQQGLDIVSHNERGYDL